ncbi:Cytochrome P450 94A1 [Morella rubra]|uniref:Cytochrome P450 94A1 n=1 Tax=Morella rubra TaxID=262757 RepID=A0A6A1WPP1_9ROSI|nr:Cytochrome P450 94A1 [Morella rubra]
MVDINSAASSPLFTLSLCLFIPLFFVIFHFLSISRSPSKSTPCPQSYPIIGNLIGTVRNRHRFHDWIADMLSQSPSSTIEFRNFLGLSHGIFTANPTNVDHLLHSSFPNYIKGSNFSYFLTELLGDGIFNVDGHLWTFQRKIASHEFKTKSLKHFISEAVSSEISDRLIPYISAACDEKRVIDLQDILQRFTFDSICHVAFGVNPACLTSDNIYQNLPSFNFVKAFDDAVDISASRFLSPFSSLWRLKRFFNIGSEKRYKEAIKVINHYAMEIIRSKEGDSEETRKDQDLLSRFMFSSLNVSFQDEEHKGKFLRDIVLSFILAGRDTTSTALTWFFWLISGHPRCARLIQTELASVPEKEQGIFSYEELKKLHYLHAAISESLRLFPPVPFNSRTTVHDDVLPDGTHVRQGWFADYSAYAMGRMDKIWGDNCREFIPERWLDDNGVFQPSDQFRFPVFHSGSRICLGKDMAYVQMKSIAAAVMYEFDILAVDGGASAEKMMNPPYRLSLVLKMRGGLPVRLRRRQP